MIKSTRRTNVVKTLVASMLAMLLFASLVAAQEIVNNTPQAINAIVAQSAFIDERDVLELERDWPSRVLTSSIWSEVAACLQLYGLTGRIIDGRAALLGVAEFPASVLVNPPRVIVVPAIAVMIRDERFVRVTGDTAFIGPFRGYSLEGVNRIVVVERFRTHRPTLRHEVLHFFMLRLFNKGGHPQPAFTLCAPEME